MSKHIAAAALLAASSALTPPRAIQSFRPRADVNDPATILADLHKAHADLLAELPKTIKDQLDPLVNAKVDAINAEVGKLQAAIDELNLRAQAATLNADRGDKRQITAEQRAHTEAFHVWLRGGDPDGAALKAAQVKAALQRQSDPDGGYLVPVEIDPDIDRVASVVGGLYSIANVKPNIKGNSYKKLVSQGGVTYGWVGETEARPATGTPTLSEIEIELGEIYVNAPASQSILDDAEEIEAWLDDEVMIGFEEGRNAALVTGSGIKKPRGLMSYDIVANASYEWGKLGYIATGGAADFAASNPWQALEDMKTALKQKYRPNARWIGNRSTAGRIRKFVDANGLPLWQPSVQLGQPATLLGHPITEDDNFADIGANAYPLAFGDFKKAYTVAEKAGLAVNLRDPYTNKPYVMFYMVKRVGGGVTNFEAVKVLKVAAS